MRSGQFIFNKTIIERFYKLRPKAVLVTRSINTKCFLAGERLVLPLPLQWFGIMQYNKHFSVSIPVDDNRFGYKVIKHSSINNIVEHYFNVHLTRIGPTAYVFEYVSSLVAFRHHRQQHVQHWNIAAHELFSSSDVQK